MITNMRNTATVATYGATSNGRVTKIPIFDLKKYVKEDVKL